MKVHIHFVTLESRFDYSSIKNNTDSPIRLRFLKRQQKDIAILLMGCTQSF